MPFFFLPPDEIKFPPAHFADLDGFLAQGGEITAAWILEGYRSGVYLWASPMEPLKWWSPDPRIIIFPDRYSEKVASSKWSDIHVNAELGFRDCLQFCETIENGKPMNPAWITGQFKNAYFELEKLGMVRFIMVEKEGQLIGCAFGAQINKVYFGEYLCSTEEKYDKIVLHLLVQKLHHENVVLMDVDKPSNRISINMDFSEVVRPDYLDLLKKELGNEAIS